MKSHLYPDKCVVRPTEDLFRRRFGDNSGIFFFLFLHEKIYLVYSLEALVMSTHIFVKTWRKLSQNYHHILLNPLTANHNNCRLLCHLLVILKVIFANSVAPDQTAPLGAV